MSYCRFSSDNWRSDVYVYENVYGGWTTHVASRRRMFGPIPDLAISDIAMRIHRLTGSSYDKSRRKIVYPSRFRKWVALVWYVFVAFWHNRIHIGSLRRIPSLPIGLPHDGKTFNDESSAACAARLIELREMGYIVPQRAIDALLSESLHD